MDEALLKKAQDAVDYDAAHDPIVKQIIVIFHIGKMAKMEIFKLIY